MRAGKKIQPCYDITTENPIEEIIYKQHTIFGFLTLLIYCKSKKIRISGKALGRPKKNPTQEEKKIAHQDNTDRIEVEKGFSLGKRCFGMGLITTKLDITIRSSIALSILAMNLSNLASAFLRALFYTFFR